MPKIRKITKARISLYSLLSTFIRQVNVCQCFFFGFIMYFRPTITTYPFCNRPFKLEDAFFNHIEKVQTDKPQPRPTRKRRQLSTDFESLEQTFSHLSKIILDSRLPINHKWILWILWILWISRGFHVDFTYILDTPKAKSWILDML